MLDNTAPGALEAPYSDSQRKPIQIVIADDHPIFRDGLRKLLSLQEDFCVAGEARDGNEVMQVLQEQEPDILLLDLKMPGWNSFTILEKLQAKQAGTKLIVLTASEDKNEFVHEVGSQRNRRKTLRYRTFDEEQSHRRSIRAAFTQSVWRVHMPWTRRELLRRAGAASSLGILCNFAEGQTNPAILYDDDGLIVHKGMDGGDTAQREGWYWFGVWIRQGSQAFEETG